MFLLLLLNCRRSCLFLQFLLRNNKMYVAFIFTGALVGERIVHNTTGALWELNNQGVSPVASRPEALPVAFFGRASLGALLLTLKLLLS